MEQKGCELIGSWTYFVTLSYGMADWYETMGCESIGSQTHIVTLNFALTHNLDLGFSRSNFEKDVHQQWDWHGSKGMWADRMLDSLCNLELCLWPCIFKIKFWKSRIPEIGWTIDMERKGCESIGSRTYYATLSYDLDLKFSRSNFEKPYPSSGMDMNGMWVNRKSEPLCDLESWVYPWHWHCFFLGQI